MENMNIQRPVSIYLCGYDSESGAEFISVPHTHHFHQMNLVHQPIAVCSFFNTPSPI